MKIFSRPPKLGARSGARPLWTGAGSGARGRPNIEIRKISEKWGHFFGQHVGPEGSSSCAQGRGKTLDFLVDVINGWPHMPCIDLCIYAFIRRYNSVIPCPAIQAVSHSSPGTTYVIRRALQFSVDVRLVIRSYFL